MDRGQREEILLDLVGAAHRRRGRRRKSSSAPPSIGAIGAIISSNIEDVNLGELPLDPFWRKAEALGLPILIHPVNVAPAPRTEKFALAQIALYTYDTTLGDRLAADVRRDGPLSRT